jgi:sedoheptulokinase
VKSGRRIIGLDLGTTSLAAVLLDAERGQVLHLAQRSNDANLPSTEPTRAEQDPRRLRHLALDVLAQVASAGSPVDGLALTGQKHGLLCVDARGRPLTPLITWQDRRLAEPLPGGGTSLDRLRERLADLDWRPNGCRLQPGYGGATLFWWRYFGRLPAGTHRVCSLAHWLAGQLTGQAPVTDPTFAASWGLYDLVRGGWNAAFVERLDLPGKLLPPVRPAGEPLAGLRPEIGARLGLPGGLPVYNPVGDTQAAYLGALAGHPAAEPGAALFLNLGTGGQVCWAVPAFELPDEAVEIRPLPPGRLAGVGPERFLRVGASLCGGAAYAWLNHTVRAWLAEFGLDVDEAAVYERLNALAAGVDDLGDLRVRPTFLGRRGDPALRGGAIEGLSLPALDLGALARATLVGIVDELRDLYRAHGGPALGHTHILATGGGVRHNPLLSGIIAGRFGLPVQVPACRETAALGAALVAHSLTPSAKT